MLKLRVQVKRRLKEEHVVDQAAKTKDINFLIDRVPGKKVHLLRRLVDSCSLPLNFFINALSILIIKMKQMDEETDVKGDLKI